CGKVDVDFFIVFIFIMMYSVMHTIDESQPNVIYHLASQTFVPTSWRAPQETMNTNILGTLNVMEAVRKSKLDPKILITGSSEEYGLVYENEIPIKETNPLRPLSPYAVSKIAQDLLGFQYFKSYGMKIIRTRAFNIIGPRSGEKIVMAAFAKQIAEIEKGANPVIHVGNLNAKRDFTDVRDIVRAYDLCVKKCSYGEVYNICSGKAWVISNALNILLGMSKVEVKISQDPSRMRPSDVEILLGDSAKFREQTGWRPEIPFEKTAEDLLNYWRNIV
ncbi:MAG: GDP-mannose 4,6-dehydratase, partial [Candidatus Aenigmarchaeota archaeon]|nr:GDP-mannose 4,6-dehydratase [Candidatus Aenigmarchaeota archaeon]MDI6722363.1 GDP-mannose 4,6-dehydratase [Candidatus Aenigmarchaeota archaeon]